MVQCAANPHSIPTPRSKTVADLHIVREHALGLAAARKIAFTWAEQVEEEFGMACTYAEGKTADEVEFTRSGVNGTLQVTAERFELNAKLGFLLGAFKDKIEAEIVKNLDQLLAPKAAKAKAPAKKK
jgi:putative polyhydroxyalkanoate system protein